jgi:superoxide reductase
MKKLIANTRDLGNERQVPVVESLDGGIVVKVGSIEHPMVDKHYIAFIVILARDWIIRKNMIRLTLPAE